MGKKGYKGIAALDRNRFVLNDDGDHVLKLLERCENGDGFIVRVIAGRKGEVGCTDAERGIDALLQRPGRLAIDSKRQIGYFTNRNSRRYGSSSNVLRRIDLSNENFAVTSIPLSLPEAATNTTIAATKGLDFNRLLLSDCGEKLIMCDRRTPLVLIVSLSSTPSARLLCDTSGMPPPLQAAVWPHGHPFCYVGAADELWKVSDNSSELLLRMSNSDSFLCHELIAVPNSDLLIALNRHRRGTGIYLVDISSSNTSYLGGEHWVAPHGMCLVPQEESEGASQRYFQLLVVETGQGGGNNNKKGGRIRLIDIAVDASGGISMKRDQEVSKERPQNVFAMIGSMFG